MPDEIFLPVWFGNGAQIALVGGKAQCLDFDDPSLFPEFCNRANQTGLAPIIDRLICQETPSGGHHLVWCCEDTSLRNMKLAERENREVLIETRGKGGYFLISPSKGYNLLFSDWKNVPTITVEEREALIELARSFNERVPEEREVTGPIDGGESPGDDYDKRGDIESLLMRHGWVKVGKVHWRRPGKAKGISASFGHIPSRFWVFSTSTQFDPEHLYKPWHVYAVLEHKGDWKAAAIELSKQGFGKAPESPVRDFTSKERDQVGPSAEVENQGKPRFELPPIYAWNEEEEQDWPHPPELVKGLLYQGAKGMIAGPSKARKTFALTDLAVSIASGYPWMGFPTAQVPVLYINLEIQNFAFRDRRRAIQKAKIGKEEHIPLFTWHLRGHGVSLPMIADKILDVCGLEGIGCIIIDPTYKLNQSGEENAASDVGALLNQFEMIALKAHAAVVFAHHFAKGDSGRKDTIDRASGSGVWARDPDAIITLNNHEKDEHMIVEMALRNFKSQESFVVKWDYPLWSRASGENIEAHKNTNRGAGSSRIGRPRKANAEDLERLLEELNDEVVHKGNKDRIMAILNIKQTTLKTLWRQVRFAREELETLLPEDPKINSKYREK